MLPKSRRSRTINVVLLCIGILCLLVGSNKQVRESIGNLYVLIHLTGLGIVISAGIALKNARSIRPWVLLIASLPLLLLMLMIFGTVSSQGSVKAHIQRGNDYAAQGEFVKAINEFTQVINSHPKLALAYYNRGNAYLRSDNCKQAIVDFTTAIEINPHDELYFNNRGATYLVLEDYEKAVVDFTAAIRLNGRLAQAYLGRSEALAQLGNQRQSDADLAKAKELDPSIDKQ